MSLLLHPHSLAVVAMPETNHLYAIGGWINPQCTGAVERYDPLEDRWIECGSLGLRFSTYATFWIKAAIKRALQEQARGLAPVLVCARVAAQPSWQHAPSLA